jgi:hypothetical protein
MPTSTRIKATNILFKIASTDYACDAESVELSTGDAPGDVRTFCEVQTGQEWKLSLSGLTSGDTASLYRLLFANYGTEVAFTVAPGGNAIPTSTNPHYVGTVIFDQLPPLSLTSGEIVKFTVELTVKNTGTDTAATPPRYFGLGVKTAA